MVGVGAPHERRHDGAVVAALGAVAVVAQPGHELDEGAGHPVDGPAGAGEGCREGEPGDGGDDQVERAPRVAAVGPGAVRGPMTSRNSATDPGHPWVSSSGRASGSGERTCRKWMSCPSMVVTNCGHSLRRASCLRQSYEVASGLRAPQVRGGHAPGPRVVVGQVGRPAGAGQAVGQVVEIGLGDLDAERADVLGAHGWHRTDH